MSLCASRPLNIVVWWIDSGEQVLFTLDMYSMYTMFNIMYISFQIQQITP